ncbi:MAG: LytR C-terminal domain-containing protein [Actinomycetota bacterium]|nr:LytR C-terminal domain-containing protein [Actinomycetota bacterium]
MAEIKEDAVRRTLRSVLEDVKVGVPAVEPVLRRGRRRRVAGRVSAVVAAAVIALAMFLPLRALMGGHLSSPASAGETYALSNFQVTSSGGGGTVSDAFHISWTGPTYPGEARCTVRLLDDSGNVVGHKQFGLTALEPENQHRPMDVDVSARPGSASGSCGPGHPPTEVYRLSHLRFSPDVPFGNELEGTATWSGNQPPGANACTVALRTSEGVELRHFSVVIANHNDPPQHLLVARDIGDAMPVDAVCEPFTRPGEYPAIPGIGPTQSPATPTEATGANRNASITVSVFNATTTPSVASEAAQALADDGFVLPDQPENSPKMLETSRVYYRRTSRSEIRALAEGLFGTAPYQLLRWDLSEPLLRGAPDSDVAIFIGKTALQAGNA